MNCLPSLQARRLQVVAAAVVYAPHTARPCAWRQSQGTHKYTWRCRAFNGQEGRSPPEPQAQIAVPPPRSQLPPPTSAAPLGASWLTTLVIVGVTISTVAGSFILFVLYLRPVLKAAERASQAAEKAAQEMELAAKEMERTAKMMQEDMPLTFQDMQRTSKEFEILGKQLNYLTGVVVKPVREPVEWVGKAAETTSSTVQNVTSTSIRKVVDDIKTLTNSLTPTLTQVRKQLGSALTLSGSAPQQLVADAASLAAAASGLGGSPSGAPLSRAAEVAAQAEVAAREVAVSRRQADAQQWISAWRSRSRGNKKAAAAAAAAKEDGSYLLWSVDEADDTEQRLAQVGQLLAGGFLHVEHEAAAAAVFAALERAQRAAEEAASASGALEAAIKQAEDNGALISSDEED